MRGTTLGRYRIGEKVGEGATGVVYRAEHVLLRSSVAIKLLRAELAGDPGQLRRFFREARALGALRHPSIVDCQDFGITPDRRTFIVMEYLAGESLAARLERSGPLRVEEALTIARQVASALAVAHEAGVVHRDLKPGNIFLVPDPTVMSGARAKVIDFGIAKLADDLAGDTLTRTRVGSVMGTPAYMSPEQCRGAGGIDSRTDVYSLGCVLFEMLTGRTPFQSDGFGECIAHHLLTSPPAPSAYQPGLPAEIDLLVQVTLAKSPDERFQSMAELLRELAGVAEASRPGPWKRADAAGPAVARPGPRAQGADVHASSTPRLPVRTAPSVALLPLRAAGDLVETAAGLSEEIVDALTRTRDLRVRPMTSVRRIWSADGDAREIGAALDVDIVIDGSITRRGDGVHIAARAIGVAEGFQLWTDHVFAGPNDLLCAGDEIARSLSRALAIEIASPTPSALEGVAIELYLQARARLGARWMGDRPLEPVLDQLEQALALVPGDARLHAALAMAHARAHFLQGTGSLGRARLYAQRAVELDPESGEAWLSLALTARDELAVPEAADALCRAVSCAPGLELAQAALGSVLLEAGAVGAAIAHLEAASSLDPAGVHLADLPRAYVYEGRFEEALELLGRAPMFGDDQVARFNLWRGRLTDVPPVDRPALPGSFTDPLNAARHVYRTGSFAPGDRERIDDFVRCARSRLRATRGQFFAELMMFVGDPDSALHLVRVSVDAGLQDHLWMERCPLLEPLRPDPRFASLAEVVARRAAEVLAVFRPSASRARRTGAPRLDPSAAGRDSPPTAAPSHPRGPER